MARIMSRLMKRRAVITMVGLGFCATPLRAIAQADRRTVRIGLLPELNEYNEQLFVDAMQEERWLKGRDFVLLEPDGASFRGRMVPAASKRAAEDIASITKLLLDQNPDLVLATSTAYALAVCRLSVKVPVVMWTSGYPVEAGIVESLGRPGKNVTGNSIYAGTGMWGKLVELLWEAKPSIKRVAVLWDYGPPAFVREEFAPAHAELANAAARLHLSLQIIEVARSEELQPIQSALERHGADGLVVTSGWGLSQVRGELMRFATDRHIPVIADFRWPATIEPYPLLVYGAPHNELMRNAAQYAVRILNGASAAELPIHQPRKFELLINLKTAAALGLKVPEMLRLRAHEVIE
jgi:putative tryptophan/tyrosine transport system substrate-binding protein